ncbi:ThuA domain-containing protein [Pedobacter gandavensis]|uniref:ThuA domain-containing protein n=1 Tax=Pedobacter gandavensis TaxID=2679963 RepID=UPI002931587B|nr:ThuA domain-containing protein [Pedobacter gandavensis]
MYRNLILLFFFLCYGSYNSFAKQKKVLIFSKTAGFHHSSIKEGVIALQKMARIHHFIADTTTDAKKFNTKNLRQYATVVFLNTSGNVFNSEQENAFQTYIKSGGGFVGVHSATNTEFEWPWFGRLVGAYFVKHPAQQFADIKVTDPKTIATSHLPAVWHKKDEWYNFKDISTDLHILLSVDESTYQGGTNGSNHPMAWYQEFEGGRAFYTGLGHGPEAYTDPLFLEHLWGGLQYAMGSKKMK